MFVLGGEGRSARAFRQNTQLLRSLPILGLSDPRTATRIVARASSLRVRLSRSIRVAPSRPASAGIPVQRFLEQAASAWRRTITEPSLWRSASSRRRSLARSRRPAGPPRRPLPPLPPAYDASWPSAMHCQPSTSGACSNRRNGHQQAFAGPQHLVGWCLFDVCDVIASRPTWCVSVDTWGHPHDSGSRK